VVSFYKNGDWVQVIVDDRLLVQGGSYRGKLWNDKRTAYSYYTSGQTFFAGVAAEEGAENPSEEIWVSIIEKAYAKLHGGYGNIQEGRTRYGVRDLTGASPYTVEAGITDEDLRQRFQSAKDSGVRVMVGIARNAAPVGGILSAHAYSILKIIDRRDKGLPVLCLCRNPWGHEGEWQGPWSDGSSEWTDATREITGYDDKNGEADGVFCIPFDECRRVFTEWDVSFLYPHSFFRIALQGEWARGSAGGCGNTGEADLLSNPQFLLEVPLPPRADMACFGQLVLSQEDVRYTQSNNSMNHIGFHIYHSPHDGGRVTVDNSYGLVTDWGAASYPNTRSATAILKHLPPGKYVVIPTTFHPNEFGPFFFSAWLNYAVTLKPL